MQHRKLYLVAPAIILALMLVAPLASNATTVQYQVLASFDFLSSDEVSNFQNVTLAATTWNTTLTSYTVSSGDLNISNKDTSDALLVYPVTLNGYAEVTLSQGVIGVFSNYNGTNTVLTGYEIVKDSNGITVYTVNGTSKSAVASLTTSADTIEVMAQDGKFKVSLSDGTGIYEGSIGDAVIALGAPASDGTNPTYGVFDKVVLYGSMLAGSYEVDLGSKTVTPSSKVVSFSYDVSKYSNVQSAKLVITMTSNDDPYARYYVISLNSDPGTDYNSWTSRGVVIDKATVSKDVTSDISSKPTGTVYVGITCGVGSWTVSAKLVLDAQAPSSSTPSTSSASNSNTVEVLKSSNWKYIAIGAGVLVFLMLIFAIAAPKGRKGIVGLATALIVFLILGGIAAAVMAWLHPEYLTAMAFGLGAIAIILVFMLMGSGKHILK